MLLNKNKALKLIKKLNYKMEIKIKLKDNEIIKELKRQIGILRNLTTTNIKHTEKSLIQKIRKL